jgi:hypothetical protein
MINEGLKRMGLENQKNRSIDTIGCINKNVKQATLG